MATSFINKAYVKKYALQYASEVRQKKFTRISKGFLDAIEYAVGEKIRRSVRNHPTVGNRQNYPIENKAKICIDFCEKYASILGSTSLSRSNGRIYIIKEYGGDNYKIGSTFNDVTIRISTLQTGNPRKLILIKQALVRSVRIIERFIHGNFSMSNLNGEWFSLGEDELRDIIFFLDELSLGRFEFNGILVEWRTTSLGIMSE